MTVTLCSMSTLRRIAGAATTPLLPEDFLDLFDPLLARTDLRGRVLAVQPETRDAVTLVIRPGRAWRGHLPGQYVRLGVDVDGVRQWRTYSLTSPDTDRLISITVKAVPGGVVSNHLVRRSRRGQLVHLDQAQGEFVLPTSLPSKLLFVTGGSGITPVMGMLRSSLHRLQDVVLVHSAPTADDVVFAGELRALAARGRIRLVELHTDVDGMLTAADLAQHVPDLAERETWVCGPTGLMDLVESHWETAGLTVPLHTERFRPTVVEPGDGGTVRFRRTGAQVEADGATTLLAAGESAGVLMPSGCRMGICFGCVLPLREGVVRDLRNGALTTAAPGDDVRIQTCISAAAGPCELEI